MFRCAKAAIKGKSPSLFFLAKRLKRQWHFRRGHGGAEYRAKVALVRKYGQCVLSGPFKDMLYGDDVACSAYVAKLVGSYEQEIHPVIESAIAKPYSRLIDVGCAEGYYAIGFAVKCPTCDVIAYDVDEEARYYCAALARLNGVAHRIDLRAACDHQQLDKVAGPGSLVICDCEGFERHLLDPGQAPALKKTDILVELHDFLSPELTPELISRFEATHTIELIDARERDPSAYPVLNCMNRPDRLWAVRGRAPRTDAMGVHASNLTFTGFTPFTNEFHLNFSLNSFMHEPSQSPVVTTWEKIARSVGVPRHRLTRIDEAECMLFVDLHLSPDPLLRDLRRHRDFRKSRIPVLVYDERDEPWNVAPGVYVSMPARDFDASTQHAFSYYTTNADTVVTTQEQPDLLFSFVGTPGHVTSGGYHIRKKILQLKDPHAILEDSSGFVFYDNLGNPDRHRARQLHFASTVARSKFVLCPRGRGTSSIRMYEVLRAGRVPVIIADEWVAPSGPDWSTCSLRVAESELSKLITVLRANEHCWAEMASNAQSVYKEWFSPNQLLARIFDLCEDLIRRRPSQQSRWVNPSYRSAIVRTYKQKARTMIGRSLRLAGLKK